MLAIPDPVSEANGICSFLRVAFRLGQITPARASAVPAHQRLRLKKLRSIVAV